MRWEDERYVRLYTRDTLTTRLLGWEGRSVLWELMRKVDRAGVVPINNLEPPAALAMLTGLPENLCGLAWEKLREGDGGTGTLLLRAEPVPRALILPNFLEAQEAVQSDKARAQKSREMARARRDTPAASRSVTDRHAQSRAVTPSRAVPTRTEPGEEALRVACASAPDDASEFARYVVAKWPDLKDPSGFEKRAREAFPAVDPLVEARKAFGWESSEPQRRKHRHGRFLWGWLGRAQDNANRTGSSVLPSRG